MKKFGLIGKQLSHSYSKDFFTQKFKDEGLMAQYELYPISELSQIREIVRTHSLMGFNVTIPYKESILHYLDQISHEVSMIQAVNCVVVKDNTWIGYNTDVIGFKYSLNKWTLPNACKALILGSGGASKAAQYVLNEMNIEYNIVSRNSKPNYIPYDQLNAEWLSTHQLIINTTPLGMFPDIEAFPPIPYHLLGSFHYCFDMIYNPSETKFLQLCKQQGAKTQNGLDMLHLQAEESFRLFFT